MTPVYTVGYVLSQRRNERTPGMLHCETEITDQAGATLRCIHDTKHVDGNDNRAMHLVTDTT